MKAGLPARAARVATSREVSGSPPYLMIPRSDLFLGGISDFIILCVGADVQF